MAKLHTHYITNAQKELKYAYAGIPDDVFQSSVQKALSDAKARDDFVEDEDGDDFDDDDKDDADDQEDQEEEDHNSNIRNQKNIRNQRNTEIENWIDINDPELKRLLNIEVNVVIEPRPLPIINHGSSEFDIEATVDKILGRNSNSNNNS